MFEVDGLIAGYGKANVLHGISLSCERGTVTALIGPNGCGKSTLLKSVIGLVPRVSGEIRIGTESVSQLSRSEVARKVAYLAQGKDIPDISVGRMVLHGRFPYLSYPRRYRKSDFAIAQQALCSVGMEEYAELPMSALSGGMRQKVYIAMALCQQAEVILLDEPTTYLDVSQQFRFADILQSLKAEQKTVVCVSHDIIAALKTSDRIAVMQSGTLRAFGTPDEILRQSVLQDVFGVTVERFQHNGATEYFYTKGENAQ